MALVLASTSTASAVFTVNSTTDAVDASPGNGLCATAGGVCTLRAAIQEANALPGDDTIILPSGVYTLTLTLTGQNEDNSATGDLDINQNLTLSGVLSATTIVDGGDRGRGEQWIADLVD